jgi:hypothetical protein
MLFGAFVINVEISTNRLTCTSRKIGTHPTIKLSTHAFQPWLLTSLMILNLRPWQSVNNARTGSNGRKQSRQKLTHSEKERYLVKYTPPRTYLVGFKWVFIHKQNEDNEVVRYKARLVTQGFTQRPGIDFNETYSPVMNGITFRYLISLATQNRIYLQLMDVVTAYLYGSLDSDIYMIAHDGISVPNANVGCNMYCVKLNKSLYGLKQSGRKWYNRLKEFLLNKGYSNNDDCPCVFIRKSSTRFCII